MFVYACVIAWGVQHACVAVCKRIMKIVKSVAFAYSMYVHVTFCVEPTCLCTCMFAPFGQVCVCLSVQLAVKINHTINFS